jgi:hypothetical protein
MKQCPQCFADYDDTTNFCAKDGRSLMAKTQTKTRLCPFCANSIDEDATNCPYCKADLLSHFVPQWLKREDAAAKARPSSDKRRLPVAPQFIWIAAILIVGLVAFFVGGHMQRGQLLLSSQANLKEIQAKDQMIQSLETQLAQVRQELSNDSNQLSEAKTKLEEGEKNLSITQQRLNVATHEIERLNASRSQIPTRTASRPVDPFPSQTRASTSSQPLPPVSQPSARRVAETGIYETTRATTVYEDPSPSSRVVSQIARGTRINVVSSSGDWLEVRSRRGNPPGYVRADDVRFVGRSTN